MMHISYHDEEQVAWFVTLLYTAIHSTHLVSPIKTKRVVDYDKLLLENSVLNNMLALT